MRQTNHEKQIDTSREYINHEAVCLKPPEWHARAACLGAGIHTNLFFPKRGESTEEAKAICRGCDVQKECLEFALNTIERFGIWGGTSEKERQELRRDRRLQQKKLQEEK